MWISVILLILPNKKRFIFGIKKIAIIMIYLANAKGL